MKKFVSAAVVLALLLAGAAAPASAGSRAIQRWQGAALALGAIGIIAAISSADSRAGVSVRVSPGYAGPGWGGSGWAGGSYGSGSYDGRYYDGRYDDYRYYGDRRLQQARVWVPGSWQTVRVWVPGSWQQVWVPGCSDRHGRYTPGRYIQRQEPGRYEDRRVWRDGSYR